MRKTITREKLRRIIAESVSEALKNKDEYMDQDDSDEEYLEQDESEEDLMQEAIDEMIPEFEALLLRISNEAKRRYPVLNNRYYMMEFLSAISDAVDVY